MGKLRTDNVLVWFIGASVLLFVYTDLHNEFCKRNTPIHSYVFPLYFTDSERSKKCIGFGMMCVFIIIIFFFLSKQIFYWTFCSDFRLQHIFWKNFESIRYKDEVINFHCSCLKKCGKNAGKPGKYVAIRIALLSFFVKTRLKIIVETCRKL